MRFGFAARPRCYAKALGFAFALAVVISACGPPTPVFEVQHALTPPPTDTGRLCAAQCLNTKQHCVQNAQLRDSIEQDRCEDRARREARRQYKHYVAQRRAKGKRIKRDEQSFYSDYKCRNTAKDGGFCLESYHQCYTTCGGQVASKSICVANCDAPVTQTGSISQTGTAFAPPVTNRGILNTAANATSLPVAGTWGITQQACSHANASKDGVITITSAEIRDGLDLCLVDTVKPMANGMYHFQTRCQSAEGGKAVPAQFYFAARTPNALTYDNRKFGRIEQWVRCQS